MSSVITYVKYFWRSTNEHGVHSPFVFDLVTRALRSKEEHPEHPAAAGLPFFDQLPRKYRKALNNTLHHFFSPGAPLPIIASALTSEDTGPDLVYCDTTGNRTIPDTDHLLKTMENDTLLLVHKKKDRALWDHLTRHPEIHLTVDCYHIGMAWKRSQQAKENFTIRL